MMFTATFEKYWDDKSKEFYTRSFASVEGILDYMNSAVKENVTGRAELSILEKSVRAERCFPRGGYCGFYGNLWLDKITVSKEEQTVIVFKSCDYISDKVKKIFAEYKEKLENSKPVYGEF